MTNPGASFPRGLLELRLCRLPVALSFAVVALLDLTAGPHAVAREGAPQSSPAGAAEAPPAEPLELNHAVTRELADGERHVFSLTLSGDEFLSLVIEQRGIDLSAVLEGPDGTKHADVNAAKGKRGSELVSVIVPTSGSYRLTIRPAELKSPAGGYEVRVIEKRVPTADERTLEEARVLSNRARTLRQAGKYDEALPLANQALSIREKVLPPDSVAIADVLNQIAIIYDDKHEYVKAEAPNLRALSIREAALGPDHPDVARSLFNLAWLAKVKQDFGKAESLYDRALSIQVRALGEEHSEVATTLNDMAVLFNQRGDHDKAIATNRRVLAIREKVLGPNDDGVAKALNNLARTYELKGEYAEALPCAERALAIWERSLGPEHAEVAFALDNLGRLHVVAGDYTAAEPFYLRAIAIREKAHGPWFPELGTTLNNLAVLYSQKGDDAKAEPLFERSLAIDEKQLGPEHAFVAPTLNNLARIYQRRGDTVRAERYNLRALAIQEKVYGPIHGTVGQTLNNLGQVYAGTADDRAEGYFTRAVATLEKAIGPEHPVIARALIGLGNIALRRGDRPGAESRMVRALAIQEKVYGPDHWEVAESLEQLSSLARTNGDVTRAIALLARAHDIRERHLAHNLQPGSERQKIGYLNLFAEDTDRAVSLHAQSAATNEQARALALTTILRRKGRALDATADSVGRLRGAATPEDRTLFDRLSNARGQLSAVTLRGPAAASPAAYQRSLRNLQESVEALETEVAARSAAFRANARSITIDTVQAAIPPDAALIEFVRYRPTITTGTSRPPARYAAYVLSSGGAARWTDLGEAQTIESAVARFREALRDPARGDARRLARALDTAVMQPVRGLLAGERHLLISPDSVLNLIPFAALVDEGNRFLIERYTITYLTSGRDLLRLQIRQPARAESVIVAAPAFGEPTSLAPRQVFFGPLPGANDEVRGLQPLLPRATVLVSERATEAALKRISGPRVLHVATHGFFLGDDERGEQPGSSAASADRTRLGRWAAWTDNPLLRSGLALAGANRGKSGDDDGVLTALEAAGLDLWGTKLVVLSACDTGIGEVRQGDGVYGLRRALVVAGAESQLMSLWPVSDRSTRDLMVGYYQRLTNGEGRSEALQHVQLQMLRNARSAHPYYWASFIQSGEWARLDAGR